MPPNLGPIRRTVFAPPALSFDNKAPQETEFFWFNFASLLASGDTLLSSGAAIVITVVSGTDPSPSSMLAGANQVEEGYLVGQLITGGVNGVKYLLTCTAHTVLGNTLVLAATLNVRGVSGIVASLTSTSTVHGNIHHI